MRRIINTTFLLLLVGSIAVQAQRNNNQERRKEVKERVEKRMGQRAAMQQGPEVMLRKLDLNDNQKEGIKAIMLEGKKEAIPFQNQLGEKKARLRTLSSGDTYDVNALNQVADEIGKLHATLHKIQIAKKGEIRELLNDDQKVVFDSMPDKRERMKKRAGLRKRK